jgi:hypothetical protein
MRIAGHPWADIAKECGYPHYRAAAADVAVVRRQRREQLAESIDEMVALQDDLLKRALAKVVHVLESDHLAHSGGSIIERVVKDSEGNVVNDPVTNEPLTVPMIDHKPILEAAREVVRISDSYRRLHGLDKPASVRIEHEGTLAYVIEGVDTEQI